MNVAITGATGLLGRYLVRHLAERGHRCRCWYRDVSTRAGFEQFDQHVTWVNGKLGDPASCYRLVEGCDAVIHSALFRPTRGQTEFRGNEGDIIQYVQNNVIGTLQLIDEARAAGVPRFVFISSCAVHEVILDDRPLDETHPVWPTSHYGAHKAAVEMFVHSYGLGHGYEICALRPCAIYGIAYPEVHSRWYPLVRDIVAGIPVRVRGGGKVVYAGDVARAAEILLTASAVAGQAYNCCDAYVSQYDIATLAKEISGSNAAVEGETARPKHRIETGKLQQLGLRFGGSQQLREYIEQLVQLARE